MKPSLTFATEAGSQTRRAFLQTALAAAPAAAASAAALAVPGSKPLRTEERLIDVNVSLGQWPTRRVRCDDSRELVTRLRRRGVSQAWAGTLEGLLHKDIAAANTRLAKTCRQDGKGLLVPFGSVNPRLPDWEEELRRCADLHRMPGIRLHPNYHGYRLEDPAFLRLLELAAQRRLIVQLALIMEDERMMHPLLRVEPVDTAPLKDLIQRVPGLRLVLLNVHRTLRAKPLLELIAAGNVSVEIAMLEGVGGVGTLLAQMPGDRVLFGSHAPLFYFESALLKLKESTLTPAQSEAVGHGNARRLLQAF